MICQVPNRLVLSQRAIKCLGSHAVSWNHAISPCCCLHLSLQGPSLGRRRIPACGAPSSSKQPRWHSCMLGVAVCATDTSLLRIWPLGPAVFDVSHIQPQGSSVWGPPSRVNFKQVMMKASLGGLQESESSAVPSPLVAHWSLRINLAQTFLVQRWNKNNMLIDGYLENTIPLSLSPSSLHSQN